MTQAGTEVYKVGVNVPAEYLQKLMESVDEVMDPLYPKYDYTFMYWPVKGTWRPLPGADPFKGNVGEIEVADEIRLEFAVRSKDIEKVIRTITEVHPYEEPAIDVIPMVPWKQFTASDGM